MAFTILALLTTMAVPLTRYKVRRDREHRSANRDRTTTRAIDNYKDASNAGSLK